MSINPDEWWFSLITWRGTHSLCAVEWLMIILPFSSSLVPSIEFFIQCQLTSICSELTSTQILIESNYRLSYLSKERSDATLAPAGKRRLFLTLSGVCAWRGAELGNLGSFGKQQRPWDWQATLGLLLAEERAGSSSQAEAGLLRGEALLSC